MATRRIFLAVEVLLAFWPLSARGGSAPNATVDPDPARTVHLCDVLENVGDGEKVPVSLEGVLAVGYEMSIFYDPEQPQCPLDIQPATWVEIPSSTQSSELERVLHHDSKDHSTRRAMVALTGVLYGPGKIPPDDAGLSTIQAYSERIANHRYGHLGLYRTKLVVTQIVSARSVPEGIPWPATRRHSTAPTIERAQLPIYPKMALESGITGKVQLEVTVDNGMVTAVHVKQGDRMLSAEAESNVRTWQFAKGTDTTFVTTFEFELQRRLPDDTSTLRVEADIPGRVRIVAHARGW